MRRGAGDPFDRPRMRCSSATPAETESSTRLWAVAARRVKCPWQRSPVLCYPPSEPAPALAWPPHAAVNAPIASLGPLRARVGACIPNKKSRPPTKKPCAQVQKPGAPIRLAGVPAIRLARKPPGSRPATLFASTASRNALRAKLCAWRPDQNGRTSGGIGRRVHRRRRSPALFGVRASPGPLRASLATSRIVREIVPDTAFSGRRFQAR
jgi:hypothetical protein